MSRKEEIKKEEINILIEMYKQLRNEILQSIQLQNRIILGEAIVVGIVYGLHLGSVLTRGEEKYTVLIAAVPLIIIVVTALWIVEQSRMMRAGNYLQFIEDMINLKTKEVILSWENWLRREGVEPLSVHRIHHYTQYIGYVGFFLILSLLALYFFYSDYVLKIIINSSKNKLIMEKSILIFSYSFAQLLFLIFLSLILIIQRIKKGEVLKLIEFLIKNKTKFISFFLIFFSVMSVISKHEYLTPLLFKKIEINLHSISVDFVDVTIVIYTILFVVNYVVKNLNIKNITANSLFSLLIVIAPLIVWRMHTELVNMGVKNENTIIFSITYIVVNIITIFILIVLSFEIITHRSKPGEKENFKDWIEKYKRKLDKSYKK